MKKWQKATLIALTAAVLVGCAASLVVCSGFGQMLVHNPAEERPSNEHTPADLGLEYETITLTTEDGYDLVAWVIPSQNGAAVIVPTGYKNVRSHMLCYADVLGQNGYGALVLDLRAHGESEGELISFGLYEVYDLEAAYQYLLTRPDVDPDRIGVLGASMGGVVAILHAAENPGVRAVAIESAFASLDDEVATGVRVMTGLPPFPFAPIIQWFAEREAGFDANEVAAVEHVGAISPRPIFLMQGGADLVIPPESGQELYEAAGEPRELWFEPEVGHAALCFEQHEEYEKRVIAFFDRYLLDE